MVDQDGYIYVMGRTDDIINVAGIRVDLGGIEEVSAPGYQGCRRVRRARNKDELKGEVPLWLQS